MTADLIEEIAEKYADGLGYLTNTVKLDMKKALTEYAKRSKKSVAGEAVALQKAKEIFKHMAIRENWSGDDISIKRTEHSGEQCGIFLYSWGRSPWLVAREFLDEIDTGIVDAALSEHRAVKGGHDETIDRLTSRADGREKYEIGWAVVYDDGSLTAFQHKREAENYAATIRFDGKIEVIRLYAVSTPESQTNAAAQSSTDNAITAPSNKGAGQGAIASVAPSEPEKGLWTLTSPTGKSWAASSVLKLVANEQAERIPATVRHERIMQSVAAAPSGPELPSQDNVPLWTKQPAAPAQDDALLIECLRTARNVFLELNLTANSCVVDKAINRLEFLSAECARLKAGKE